MYDATGLAQHLKSLRDARGLSLEQLAKQSGVSRASLGRIETGQVSPTTETLAKLCACYGVTMSKLLSLVEETFTPLIPAAERPHWTDPNTGFTRTLVSPQNSGLMGEWLACTLPAHQTLKYDGPPRPRLEHHLLLQTGALWIEVDGASHALRPGDCLRYVLQGPSTFRTQDQDATYFLFMV